MLQDFINPCDFLYLDDILIFSKAVAEHQVHVRQILHHFLENRLFVKAEKCQFHVNSVGFFGSHHWARESETWSSKGTCSGGVAQTPRSPAATAFFYRHFIREFSKITLPLTRITSPKVPCQWDRAAQQAFTQLKERFSTAPILRQQFIVEVDASNSGVWAVLSQQKDDKLHLCVFFSRQFSPTRYNYDIGDWELLAIKLL